MENNQFRILIISISALFLICFMGTCNSCSTARKVDVMIEKQDALKKQLDAQFAAQDKVFDIRLQLLQPQVVNQFLGLFNSEKYKNEIDLNGSKIETLKLQLKNEQMKNDTTKKH